MKNCRINKVNIESLLNFPERRNYSLQEAGPLGKTTVVDCNITHIFNTRVTAKQMKQIYQSKHGLLDSSTAELAEDTGGGVQFILYEMVKHFVQVGGLRCIFNDKLLVELSDVKVAPPDDVDFEFEGEPYCPLVVAAFHEVDIFNKVSSNREFLEWKRQILNSSNEKFEIAYLEFKTIPGPVYDTILSLLTVNARKVSHISPARLLLMPPGFKPTFLLPTKEDHVDPLTCYFPGCNIHAESRCGRCRVARYCTTDHQKAHWKEHKVTCSPRPNLDTDKSIVVSIKDPGTSLSYTAIVPHASAHDLFLAGEGSGLKSKFIVKVQSGLAIAWDGTPVIDKDAPILIYDAKKALVFRVAKNAAHKQQHETLLANVAARGVVTHVGIKSKAYFYARKEDDNLRIYMEEVSETPDW